jgi:beta-glucosidase
MYDVFSLPEIQFPPGFLWGSATAAHQVEGDNVHSNWWHRERDWAEPSARACNHYELYREDVDLLAALGHRAYRFSLGWSRIEPADGRFDEAAIDHYVDLMERLREKGICVCLTLHHFTHPQWFEEKGEFCEIENLKYWERFLSKVVPRFAPLVDNWNVFNEFNLDSRAQRKRNMIRAHALGYHLIKQYSEAPVSTAHAFVDLFPFRRHDPFDNAIRDLEDFRKNAFFFHAVRTGELLYPEMDAEYHPDVKNTMDYWAVNTYVRHMVDARRANAKGDRFVHKSLKMIPRDFYLEEMFPEGLISNVERLGDLPVYITENGCSCDDDRWRIVWIALHLTALREAIDRGVDVRGYFYWSLMDNYEWGSFLPRFGLVHVDFETFKRTPKPSAEYYKAIIERNGLTPELTKRYLDRLPTLASPSD